MTIIRHVETLSHVDGVVFYSPPEQRLGRGFPPAALLVHVLADNPSTIVVFVDGSVTWRPGSEGARFDAEAVAAVTAAMVESGFGEHVGRLRIPSGHLAPTTGQARELVGAMIRAMAPVVKVMRVVGRDLSSPGLTIEKPDAAVLALLEAHRRAGKMGSA